MERRDFCAHAYQVATLAALGLLADACGGGSPSSPSGGSSARSLALINGTSAGSAVTVTVDAASPLATVGGAALVQAPSGVFLAFRSTTDAISALTSVCTHEGCMITQFASPVFECECHGSQFNTNGSVAKGSATRSLQRFTTTFASNVLTINS